MLSLLPYLTEHKGLSFQYEKGLYKETRAIGGHLGIWCAPYCKRLKEKEKVVPTCPGMKTRS
jgi:hypothetical protein